MDNLIGQIGKQIYVTLSEFKGKRYIDVRKYYADDEGEMKPTRKGISFNAEDWREFVSKIQDIDSEVKNALGE